MRGAVVGDRARDDLVLEGLALQLPELLSQLEGCLDGLAAAGREEHAVQVAGCLVGQAVGQLDRRRVRVRPQREERELFGLLRSSLSKPLAAVARVDDEQAGEAVEVALAAVIPDVVAFAAHDDGHPGGVQYRLAGEVHPQVVLGLLLQIGGGVHDGSFRGAVAAARGAITACPSRRAVSRGGGRQKTRWRRRRRWRGRAC